MKFGVVVFPGSNCDSDAFHALRDELGAETEYLFHKEHDLRGVDVVVLPGGFSYGDYLRSGAIARFSPIMNEVIDFARQGGVVVGICNGFQILCESGLLPGALIRNASRRFVCRDVWLRVERNDSIFTSELSEGDVLRIPVAHGEGNYFADENTLRELQENRQILFRYSDEQGNVTAGSNPNGSQSNIAGIVNDRGNVLGMMPHPERACTPILGSDHGLGIFRSLLQAELKVHA